MHTEDQQKVDALCLPPFPSPSHCYSFISNLLTAVVSRDNGIFFVTVITERTGLETILTVTDWKDYYQGRYLQKYLKK